jgi:formylglycine-generating enzyme required for sulfatase activity
MTPMKAWAGLSRDAKHALLARAQSEAGFELQQKPARGVLPTLEHRETGTQWVLLPGGSVEIGLSEHQESAARQLEDPPPLNLEEMRPCHRVTVEPMLMMQAPINRALAVQMTKIDLSLSRPKFGAGGDLDWFSLRRDEVDEIQRKTRWLLPSEYQWEYACRAGRQTLFFFGDELPPARELERYVTHHREEAAPNPAGLYGLFIGEWCRDHFRPTYDTAPTNAWVVRGGASAFWPWQGSEWAFCASAMRMPSTDLIDGLAGARFVVELG